MEGTRAILVDDQARFVHALRVLLDAHGWEARAFTRPDLALASCIADPPYVLITDLQMPVMSGADLARRVRRELVQAAPLIVCATGHDALDIDTRLAFDVVLAKPFRYADLERALRPFSSRKPRVTRSGTQLKHAYLNQPPMRDTPTVLEG